MTEHEKYFLFLLVPLLFVVGLHEIRRSIKIFRDKIYTPSAPEFIRRSISRMINPSEEDHGIDGVNGLSRSEKMSGVYSLIGGIFMLLAILYLVFTAVFSR